MKNNKGFTLVECMAVAFIVGILSFAMINQFVLAGKVMNKLQAKIDLANSINIKNGQSGITAVQLCTGKDGVTPQYGLCLNSTTLYLASWTSSQTNLVQATVGTYTNNGAVQCNFQYLGNCQVNPL